jgi:hypothetical protein
MSTDELLQALLDVDDEFREALIAALQEDKDALKDYLRHRGYGPYESEDVETGEGPEDSDEWTVIGDEEHGGGDATHETSFSPDVDLTPAEHELYELVQTVDTPRSAKEVVTDLVEGEHPELLEEYSSLGNRGWVSSKLNKFAKEGLIGKYREGREMKYTADIEMAVRNWALKNDVHVEDLSNHAERIGPDTGMNQEAIDNAVRSITQ